MTGLVILSRGASCTVEADGVIYNCVMKGKLRLKGYKSTNPISVGDLVDFELNPENDQGVISKIHVRRNCIVRKSTNLSKETHIIASNIDQAIFIFTMRNPETSTVFLDRFLVAAESYNIPVVIVFNKIDIYREDEFDSLAEIMSTYNLIGYEIIETSVSNKYNLDKIANVLKGRNTVISGHSGVGKSSLINYFIPDINLKTTEISESTLSGKHTTTFAQMFKLPFGGYIIDTPGIRGFGVVKLKKEEIYHYFPEIFRFSHDCKYHNCTHINEPGCAVMHAIEEGEIPLSRYKSYLNIYYDDESKHRAKDV